MNIGTPLTPGATRVLLLGSGELGKELTIELMRLGVEVVACDRYANAPAMQVAHRSVVFDMTDAQALRRVAQAEAPHLIVPEIEAIATQELVSLEKEGFKVVPTAQATWLTMNREGIRRVAAEELHLPTSAYRFADTFDELKEAADALGYPCVIKPVMSSSGKGQSVARRTDDLPACWEVSQTAGRTGPSRIIVEAFVPFESEITLLTVRAVNGTFFCPPIGHRQVEGDYVESWQPHAMDAAQLSKAQDVARAITERLGGFGLFGVELFLLKDGGVVFSEVSPRPHDTGMVTLATQPWSEFALHARAILGLPIPEVAFTCPGASVALRADRTLQSPVYDGLDAVFEEPGVDVRLFGKPDARPKRRMGVVLSTGSSPAEALAKANRAANKVKINSAPA